MKCKNCGLELGDNDLFCPRCGATTSNMPTGQEWHVKGEPSYQNNPNSSGRKVDNNNLNTKYNSNNKSPKTENTSSKIEKLTAICVIINILITIMLAVFMYLLFSKYQKYNVTSESNDTSNVTTNEVQNDENTKENYEVKLNNFKLHIPSDMNYGTVSGTDAINVINSSSTWVAQISIHEISFEKVKQNLDELKNQYAAYVTDNYNGSIENLALETINGTEFIVIEIKIAETNKLIAYAELNSKYSICFEINSAKNIFDRTALKDLSPIVSSAEFDKLAKSLEINAYINPSGMDATIKNSVEKDDQN